MLAVAEAEHMDVGDPDAAAPVGGMSLAGP